MLVVHLGAFEVFVVHNSCVLFSGLCGGRMEFVERLYSRPADLRLQVRTAESNSRALAKPLAGRSGVSLPQSSPKVQDEAPFLFRWAHFFLEIYNPVGAVNLNIFGVTFFRHEGKHFADVGERSHFAEEGATPEEEASLQEDGGSLAERILLQITTSSQRRSSHQTKHSALQLRL